MFPGRSADGVGARHASPFSQQRKRRGCGTKGEACLAPTLLAPCPGNIGALP
jgi:hypothetical protein